VAGVNYAVSIPARYEENQYITNADHQLTSNNRLMFKSIISGQPAFQPLPAATVPGFGTTQDFKSRIMSLTDTHIITPNLVNEARMGFSRLLGVVLQENKIPLSAIGMQRFNAKDFPDIPQITVTGVFSLGYSVNADQGVAQDTYHFVDTLSWIRGKHQIRTGVEMRRYVDDYYSNNRFRGSMTIQSFGDFLTGLPGTPTTQGGNGTGFSNINTSSVASGVTDRMDRITDLAFYVQDDWKITSRLSLNISGSVGTTSVTRWTSRGAMAASIRACIRHRPRAASRAPGSSRPVRRKSRSRVFRRWPTRCSMPSRIGTSPLVSASLIS